VQRVRVAVADLSGSALKMQTATVPTGQPQAPGAAPAGSQTTVSIALPPPAEFARGLTEMLTSVLVKTNRFTVLERSAMQQIDAEQALAAAGKTTKETGASPGGLLGAQMIITGDITGFSYQRTSLGGALTNVVKGLSLSGARVTAEVIIDLRLVDATTGAVLHSTKGTGKADQTGVAADLVKAEKSYSADAEMSTPLGRASRSAIEDAVIGLLAGMPKTRWTARVIDVRDGVVYVNAAAADGMRAGLALEVFEAQPPLIDPATGQSLGAPERHVGTITIDNVQEKFSTARITSGDGITRGLIVRFKGG
jgi:curli biogenesis system outer membrane secretion channel CsgG